MSCLCILFSLNDTPRLTLTYFARSNSTSYSFIYGQYVK